MNKNANLDNQLTARKLWCVFTMENGQKRRPGDVLNAAPSVSLLVAQGHARGLHVDVGQYRAPRRSPGRGTWHAASYVNQPPPRHIDHSRQTDCSRSLDPLLFLLYNGHTLKNNQNQTPF